MSKVENETVLLTKNDIALRCNRSNLQKRIEHRKGALPGASFDKSRGKWESRIRIKGASNPNRIGRYGTELEAHAAYLATLDALGLPFAGYCSDLQREKVAQGLPKISIEKFLARLDRPNHTC